MTGYHLTTDEKKFKRWKFSFKQVCKLPAQQDCSIEDDFSYLEIKGLLEIGNYDTLIDVLDNVDKEAVKHVKGAMKEIQKRQGTLNSEAVEGRHAKLSKTLFKVFKLRFFLRFNSILANPFLKTKPERFAKCSFKKNVLKVIDFGCRISNTTHILI